MTVNKYLAIKIKSISKKKMRAQIETKYNILEILMVNKN